MKNYSRRDAVLTAVGALVGARGLSGAPPAVHDHSGTPPAPLQQGVQQDSTVARLAAPWKVGRDQPRITRYENDPYVIGIEERVKCTCGCAHSIYTCRTTDFSCGYWQAHHAKIIAQVELGMTADEIVATYAMDNGEHYLMAPPPRGFNLMAYIVPGAVITTAAAGIMWALSRRAELQPQPQRVVSALSAEDEARLAAEFERLDL